MNIVNPWTKVSTLTHHTHLTTHMTITTRHPLLMTLTIHKHKHILRHTPKVDIHKHTHKVDTLKEVTHKKEDIPRLLLATHLSMIRMVSQLFINSLPCIKHTHKHKRVIPNNQLLMVNSRCNQPQSTATPCMTPHLNKLTHNSNTSKIHTKKTNQRTIERIFTWMSDLSVFIPY